VNLNNNADYSLNHAVLKVFECINGGHIMTERKLQQFISMLFILALVAINASPVLATDSGNISLNATSDLSVTETSNLSVTETSDLSVTETSDLSVTETSDSSVNATCEFNNPDALMNGSLPDNETLQSLACFSPVQEITRSAAFASSYSSCVGDGHGLMEIHAPPGSVYAARGPWGWFDGGNPNWVPTSPSGVTCRIVDTCSSSRSWEIRVMLPDGSIKSSGIFAFNQPGPAGSNARCYKLFEASSGSTINIPSLFGSPSSNYYSAYSYEPINLATGNYFYQHQDQFIPGRGLPLSIDRYYNSLDSSGGPFGSGWTFNYNMNLIVIAGSGNVLVKREDGRVDTYTPKPDGTYSPPPGNFNTLVKNADGSYTLETKHHITYHFTPAGQLIDIVDTNGNTLSLTYTGSSLTRVTDSSGRELVFTYDAAGRIISIADPIGRTSSYTYDTNGNLIRFSDPMGGEFSYTYDNNHWMTSITNPRGSQMHNVYDADGRVTSQSNALGAVYRYSYDITNRITTETDPLGRNTVYTFDNKGWELSETDDLGNTISYAYDNENRISATDAIGRTARFSYDAVGNVIQVVDPLGQSSTLNYDSNNNLVSATNALGRQVLFSYDANNNLLTVTNPAGSVSTFAYDQYGQLISGRDANGHDASLVYDNNGYPTAVTDALGNTIMLSYDGVGRLTGITDANGGTGSFSYDALDRLVTVVDPSGNSASISYDSAGNRISTTDALGRTTSYSYDPMDQLTRVTDATGGTVNYAYDTVNNRVSMTDANGHTTTYAYDRLNRLSSVTDPLGRISRSSYDAVGNTVSVTDSNGNTTGLTYDALNRPTGISYADQTSVGYTYDAIGNRLSMTDTSGTTSYSYDALNQLTSVASPGGKTVTYGYDAVGNTLRTTYPDGKTVSYAYDDLNRLSGVTDWTGIVTSYVYDANSNLAEMTYPNGVTTEYSYDKNNRLVTQVNKVRHGLVSSYEYTLDAVGNRVQVKEKYDYTFSKEMREQGVGEVYAGIDEVSRQKGKDSKDGITLVTTYGYDQLNRLNKVTYPLANTVTYTYDPMGNRLSMVTKLGKVSSTTNYNYDAADELLSAGSTTYTYDNNGNLIKKTEPGKTTTYGYDGANRLSTVTLSQSSGHRMAGSDDSVNEYDADPSRDSVNEKDTAASRNAGKGKVKTTTVHFTYDGDGVRTEKSVTSQSKTDATRYLWDINHGLPQVLTESDGKDTALYSYGLGRISMADPRKGQMYYQYDGLGSVRSLSDRKGMTRGLYAYDSFGKPLLSASPVDNDFQYTGEQVDDETGLIYLRSRYYDPEIGRFISRDPFAGFDTSTQSLNRYTYVQNNPVRYADPSGKNPVLAAVGLAGFYGACANTGWYIGEQAAIYVQTGENRGSWATLGGRAAGGFAAGSVGAATMIALKNPFASGAAAGGSGYLADRGTQWGLSQLGLGRAEPYTNGGLALATGTGTVMGPVTNMIIPSPAATQWLGGGRADISRTGTALLNSAYNSAPSVYNDAYNYAINSCQGPPLRVGGGSYSAGKLK
jgi:RHS repeat-associated protein